MKNLIFFYLLFLPSFLTAQNSRRIDSDNSSGNQYTHEILIDGVPTGKNIEIISFIVEKKLRELELARIEFSFSGETDKLIVLNRQIEIRVGMHNSTESLFFGSIGNFVLNEVSPEKPVYWVDCIGKIMQEPDLEGNQEPVLNCTRGVNIIESHLELNNELLLRGEIKINGTLLAIPGYYIELEGFGSNFDGVHRLFSVVYEYHENNFWTILRIGNQASI